MAEMKDRKAGLASVNSLNDPFDSETSIGHDPSGSLSKKEADFSTENIIDRAIESSVVRAIFSGNDQSRRLFLKKVGAAGALAAISSVLPLDAVKSWANESVGPLEKTALKIGFIPITCATPIIMAQPMGFYDKYGLKGTEVIKASGWSMVRDWAVSKQVDCAHMLSPMPLALTIGAGSKQTPFLMPAVENINGQAITLHNKHKGVTGPQDMKGFTFCVPFDYSMHNMLLRYYLAEGGVDPDKDVKIRVVPPPEMVANLRAGNVDGYLAPDPFNQRAVYEKAGFIFKLTKDIWPGHPCCAFAASQEFATTMPNTFKAVFRAIVDATHYASNMDNRKDIAKAISPRNYLNQPEIVVEQVLTGEYPDGLGNTKSNPDRIDFNPFPYHSMAVWILTQMKRWGYIKGDINYTDIAEKVFLATDCAEMMSENGYQAPSETYIKHTIMGKEFDPMKPEEYLKSFAISRA